MARNFPRGARRQTKTWSASGIESGGISVTTTQAEIVSILNVQGDTEVTLLRTRGEILVQGIPDANTDSDILGLGLMLIPETTRAVGGASMPGPIVDASADFWLWHNFVCLAAGGATAVDGDLITLNKRIDLDAKAMRRWPSDMSLVLIAEANEGDFVTLTVQAAFRALTGH